MKDVYPVPESMARSAYCDAARYREMYDRSIADPEGFWAEQAEILDWYKKPTKIKDVDFAADARIRWYEDGQLNVCHNCVDRHLDQRGDQVALIWEGDDPSKDAKITYRRLHDQVCRLANVLKDQGVRKGDRV
ncbi:MAG: AMP-binding protein, partial [Geminicoccaceae bacterium]|nr:AMP-binding protein [Geminicoccaceae bacterium]